MSSTTTFVQGVVDYVGEGLDKPLPPQPDSAPGNAMTYVVPEGVRAQAVYFRGGNSGDDLAVAVMLRDGVVARYFPIGARDAQHVPLRVVEDLEAGTTVEIRVAAPSGATGSVVVDLGLVEV